MCRNGATGNNMLNVDRNIAAFETDENSTDTQTRHNAYNETTKINVTPGYIVGDVLVKLRNRFEEH